MPSLIKGYEYDIFISYRQKDNKADKWVTHFVEALKDEIEATFKEDISIYFDENPHDGLLETHDVDQSLSKKIKVLVLIPIISQTYCDPNCFAWQKEFIAFRDFARADELGLDIRLASGNVCKRIFPVRIHEIDAIDQQLYEKETGGVMRSVDFIYHSPGVNRPLRPNEEHPDDNLYKTLFIDQINKVANGVKEIISALQQEDPNLKIPLSRESNNSVSLLKISRRTTILASIFTLILAITAIWYFKFYNTSQVLSETSRNARVAIIPFQNNTNDPELDVLGDMAADWITRGLMNFDHIKVVSFETVRDNIDYAVLKDSNMRANFADRTGAGQVINGSFYLQGDNIILQTQVIDIKTGEVELVLPIVTGEKSNLEDLVSELNQRVMTIFGVDPIDNGIIILTNPPKYEAYKMYIKGMAHFGKDYDKSRKYMTEAIRWDSSFLNAYITLYFTYSNQGRTQEKDSVLEIILKSFNSTTPIEKLQLDFLKSSNMWDDYSICKEIYELDTKSFLMNVNMALFTSRINKPNEVINVCQVLNPNYFNFKITLERWWFQHYSYNLIRLNKLDEALEVLEVVPPEFMDYLYYRKALVFVLKKKPDKIHKMIAEMEILGLEQGLITGVYLYTSDWYELQGDTIGQMEWANLALAKINSRPKSDEINQSNLAWAYYGTRNFKKALSIDQDIATVEGRSRLSITMIGLDYAKSGSHELARNIINELESFNTSSGKYGMAQVYSALNEKDLAVKYLIEAFEDGYGFRLGRYDTDCELVPLHGHPGYEKLIKPKG